MKTITKEELQQDRSSICDILQLQLQLNHANVVADLEMNVTKYFNCH